MPLGYHVCIEPRGRETLIKTPEQRRVAARIVLRQGRKHDLLAFGAGEQHLHMHTGPCADPTELARTVESALTQSLDLAEGFERAHVTPIKDSDHMYNTFRYDLTQSEHHGLSNDPMFEGTNLLDMLAGRLLGGYTTNNVRRLLPGIDRQVLLGYLGVDSLKPADGPLEWLVTATLAAAALPALDGHRAEVSSVRCAAIVVAGDRLSRCRLAQMLNVGERTIYRLAKQQPDERMVLAIRMQLGLITKRMEKLVGAGPFR